MKKALMAVLVLLFCVGSVYAVETERVGRFDRFVWEEALELDSYESALLEPIDTSQYSDMVVQIKPHSGNFKASVYVYSSIYEEDRAGMAYAPDGGRTYWQFTDYLNSANIAFKVTGAATEIRITNETGSPVILRVTGALSSENYIRSITIPRPTIEY
ncbi:hypothetical protein ACFL38_02160 [Candidatus Omnitrophota bacterium]